MIEEETDKRFVDICKQLKSEGLSPTEIAKRLHLKSSKYISQALYLDKLKNETEPYFPELKKTSFSILEKEIPKLTGMTYKEFLYQKYIVEGLSTYQISNGLLMNNQTVYNHLQGFGINKNMSVASQDSIRMGRKDYKKITSESRKTRNKILGSFSQDVAREVVKYQIEQNLLKSKGNYYLEFIVGYNEYGILLDKEVDIPIVVIDNLKNEYYKFAIEYNGEYFHKSKRNNDKVKNEKLKHNKWQIYYLEHTDNMDNSKIEKQVKDIIDDIFQQILGEGLRK